MPMPLQSIRPSIPKGKSGLLSAWELDQDRTLVEAREAAVQTLAVGVG